MGPSPCYKVFKALVSINFGSKPKRTGTGARTTSTNRCQEYKISQSEFQALDNLGWPLVANLFCVRYLTLTNSKPTSLIQSNRCQSFEFCQLKLSVPESRGTICKRRGKSVLMWQLQRHSLSPSNLFHKPLCYPKSKSVFTPNQIIFWKNATKLKMVG